MNVKASGPPRSSAAVEDYLKRILELISSKGYARVVDIANRLGVSQASVSSMVQRLDAERLVKYEKYRGLVLTVEGDALARGIAERHDLLVDFLTLLGVEGDVAQQDVDGLEHHLSAETLQAIRRLTHFLKENPDLLCTINQIPNS